MWTRKRYWLGVLVVGAMCFGGQPATADDSEAVYQETAAEQYQRQRLAAIDADREGAVQALAEQWSSASGESVESLAASILYNTTAQDLVAIQDATTFGQVQAIILNQPEGETVAALTLGELDEDLVYTPVTPCRIVDTRFGGGGVIPAGGSRNYWVHGSVGSQGGNPAGCPSPTGGDPRAVHVNVTVVPVGGNGFVKVYPKGTAEPNASLVNFKKGSNIANAATIKTCFNCNQDITVKVKKASAHVIIDVLGFYYPAKGRVENRNMFPQSSGIPTQPAVLNHGTVSIVAPGPGTIVVRATAGVKMSGEDTVVKFGIEDTTGPLVGINTFDRFVEVGKASGTASIDHYHSAAVEHHYAVTGATTRFYRVRAWRRSASTAHSAWLTNLVLSAEFIPE